jgi:hypothetical protein
VLSRLLLDKEDLDVPVWKRCRFHFAKLFEKHEQVKKCIFSSTVC